MKRHGMRSNAPQDHEERGRPAFDADLDRTLDVRAAPEGRGGPPDGVSDRPDGVGGKPDGVGGGDKKGDLYGDQYVFLRDLDASDGDGNGEVILDLNGNPILIGTDGLPIYYVPDPDAPEDYIIDPDRAAFVQEVELGRTNVARAPDKVFAHALDEALGKVDAAETLEIDAAGRIVADGVTIDSPLENLALYQFLMRGGVRPGEPTQGDLGWPAVTETWPDAFTDLRATYPAWDPASLLGAAFSKDAPVTLDAVLYENTTLELNVVGGNGEIDYFDFSQTPAPGEDAPETFETYDYDRIARYGGVEISYYEKVGEDLERTTGQVLDVIFGDRDGDVEDGEGAWIDANSNSGVDDFAQAVEDARMVISFLHDNLGATIDVPTADAIM